MPTSEFHLRIAKTILASVYQNVGSDGMMNSFIIQRPGRIRTHSGFVATIYFRRSVLIQAVTLLRSNGPAYLRHLSPSILETEIRTLTQDHFWVVGESMILQRGENSLLERATEAQVQYFADILANSHLFRPNNKISLFPLIPINVDIIFEGKNFCLTSPDTIAECQFLKDSSRIDFVATQFPPFANWKGKKKIPAAWLLLNVPHSGTGKKLSAAVLGSLALTIPEPYRYQFTEREMFGGSCQLDGQGYSFKFHNALTPALSQDILLGSKDHEWLHILDQKLSSSQNNDVRQIKALQYYYRAWFLSSSERFPIKCMALDSILGADGAATDSLIRGVRTLLGDGVEWERLSLLMRLRGSVMHGGAPDVYESSKYAKYYSKYGEDPISDMDVVVTECLRRSIFSDAFIEQIDPFAQIIKEQRELGRIAPQSKAKTILG